jgi:hypothetical protein
MPHAICSKSPATFNSETTIACGWRHKSVLEKL